MAGVLNPCSRSRTQPGLHVVSPKSGWRLQILLSLAVSCCQDVLPLFMVHTGCPSAYKAPASSLQRINWLLILQSSALCHLLQEVLPAQVLPSEHRLLWHWLPLPSCTFLCDSVINSCLPTGPDVPAVTPEGGGCTQLGLTLPIGSPVARPGALHVAVIR